MAEPSKEQATVWRGGGRRWFTRTAACRAEARSFLKREIDAMGEEGIPTSMWMREVALLTQQIAAGHEPTLDWDAAQERNRAALSQEDGR